MNPPWSPGVDSIASQYSPSVPLLLPIAWLNSHMMSGCRWAPERACVTIAEIGGDNGPTRALAGVSPAPAYFFPPPLWGGGGRAARPGAPAAAPPVGPSPPT